MGEVTGENGREKQICHRDDVRSENVEGQTGQRELKFYKKKKIRARLGWEY